MLLDKLSGTPVQVLSEQYPAYTGDTAKFVGLFSPSIPARCWLDKERIILSCPQGEITCPVVVNLADKTVAVVGSGVTVLDVHDGLVLGSASDPLTPPHLAIARVSDLKFQPVSPSPPPCPVPGLTWSTILVSDPPATDNPGAAKLAYTAHYVGPDTVVSSVYSALKPIKEVSTKVYRKTALFIFNSRDCRYFYVRTFIDKTT